MVCLGVEPEAAGWKAQTNPLSCTPNAVLVTVTQAVEPTLAKPGPPPH